jgi:hypothetical protein
MTKPDAFSPETCFAVSRSTGRWGSRSSEYLELIAAGTVVPAGAAVPGVG